jgi:predicted permease
MMRFYRALLRLYPSGFRAEYRHELCATFEARTREHSGPLAALVIALEAVADVVPNAVAAHWDILRQDLRYGARSLRRTPGFAITAVLVVALGVGANTAAFSLADFALLRPLPFTRPDRLVRLWTGAPGYGRWQLSPANYRDWKEATRSVSGMAAFSGRGMNLVGAAEPRRLELIGVTPDLFQVLGVPAWAGRTVLPADSADAKVIVLGHALWQTQFGADPRAIGSVVTLNGDPYTVIGVMPPSFRFPTREADAWTPMVFREADFADRTDSYIDAVARIRDGVSLEQARDEFAMIAARLERQYPKENEHGGAIVWGLRDEVSRNARLLLLALCGASLCILLLACANLASLLLARATHRARELAVRAALGAGRERLVRQLVTESIGLAVVGGTVGVLLAVGSLPALARLVPAGLPVAAQPSVDLRVLLVAAVLMCLTGLAFGVGPAVAGGRSKAFAALREGTRTGGGRTQRVRAGLVIVEVAASVVLLISSGLLIRAVMRIQSVDPGFKAERVLTMRTVLPWNRYVLTARREQFYARVLQDVRALPGVQGAGYVTGLPMSMRGGIWPVALPGDATVRRDPSKNASIRFVTPGYFATLGIPLRAGRDVAESDGPGSPQAAVVSEGFVNKYWPGSLTSAIGQRFTIGAFEGTVVGVVGDVHFRGLEQASEPQAYLSSAQMPDSSFINYPPKDLVVRSTASTAALVPAIRRIVLAADPEQPISNIRMMSEILSDETVGRVTQVRVLGLLALIALFIAGVGIHGLLTFAVSRRSQELGVRRALGEQAGSIVRRVLREGMALALAGVGIGVLIAYWSARAMGALLAGIQPGDPVTIVGAAVICFGTAIAGCVRPAMRAARVDPIEALRGE